MGPRRMCRESARRMTTGCDLPAPRTSPPTKTHLRYYCRLHHTSREDIRSSARVSPSPTNIHRGHHSLLAHSIRLNGPEAGPMDCTRHRNVLLWRRLHRGLAVPTSLYNRRLPTICSEREWRDRCAEMYHRLWVSRFCPCVGGYLLPMRGGRGQIR